MRFVGKTLKARTLFVNTMRKRLLSVFICILLLISIPPATASPPTSESTIWGISYDWGDFENDVLNMTGVDTNAANEDLESAADYAGFSLESDQVLSGSTHILIDSWDDNEEVIIYDTEAIGHVVTKRITELTIRHGILADVGFSSSWSDGNESIDIWLSASQESVIVIDASYTEYVDSNLMVYGADLEMNGYFQDSGSISLGAEFAIANELESPVLDLSYSISLEIPNINSEWRSFDEPLDYLHHISDSAWDNLSNGEIGSEYDAGVINGQYSTVSGYTLSAFVGQIDTINVGINLDSLNVELSDNIPSSGSFSENMSLTSGAYWNSDCNPVSGIQNISIDDSAVEVQCGIAPPISPGMAFMMGMSLVPAFDNGFRELSDVVQNQIEEWREEIENSGESGGSVFICDNGEEIPAEWENDGEEDCSDGSDETGGATTRMIDALNETDLEKTLRAFYDRVKILAEDNVPSEPVIDIGSSCGIMFWTKDDSRVVGFALLNDDNDDGLVEVLLGPDILGTSEHSIDLNLVYVDGEDARNLKNQILGISELREIAPLSKHDDSGIYEILGSNYLPELDTLDTDGDGIIDYFDQDDDNDGIPDWDDPELNKNDDNSVPSLGAIAILSIIAIAAIIRPRRDN